MRALKKLVGLLLMMTPIWCILLMLAYAAGIRAVLAVLGFFLLFVAMLFLVIIGASLFSGD